MKNLLPPSAFNAQCSMLNVQCTMVNEKKSATLTNYRTLLETLSPLLISSSGILFLVCNSATKVLCFFEIQSHYPNFSPIHLKIYNLSNKKKATTE